MWVQDSYGFYVTGSYWYFKGIYITRAGYQGAYVTGTYNTFENCAFYNNRNTGLEINKGGSYTTVINCEAYHNYDPKKLGSMADGIAPKQTQDPGNKIIGCRVWENSDDGYDCFDSPEVVTFENCWAFRNGVDIWNYGGFDGNGNGFKVGGNYQEANHVLTNCVAFDHPNKGFDQNNNSGGITIYNCTSYRNGRNYGMGNSINTGQTHILKNNISLDSRNSNAIANAIDEFNTWNTGFNVGESDFISLDTSLAVIERNADGSLPYSDLFQLAEVSLLVDAGTDVGLAFQGNAPDLGCFESPFSRTPSSYAYTFLNESFNNYPNPVSNNLYIDFNHSSGSFITIRLISLTGKETYFGSSKIYTSGTNSIVIDCSTIPEGIYTLQINLGKDVYTEKIIINKT